MNSIRGGLYPENPSYPYAQSAMHEKSMDLSAIVQLVCVLRPADIIPANAIQ